jgi:(heptosyl)LPS beta-1,4-glucosyltransferase
MKSILFDLTICILAGNEEEMIVDCLNSCQWCPNIILVAANSTDRTIDLAQKTVPNLKLITTHDEYNKNFSKWRNLGFKACQTTWLLYVDADERITPPLAQEIKQIIANKNPPPVNFYAIPRANHFLGQRVRYGGTYPDYVKRLFYLPQFQGFQGILHEEPLVAGQPQLLCSDLLHFTHRNLSSMLQKSLIWTDMEAHALFQSQHPPIVWWRIIRMMLTKFFERLIVQQMWRDGTVGWISAIFETFDTFMIYSRLWELQQKDTS